MVGVAREGEAGGDMVWEMGGGYNHLPRPTQWVWRNLGGKGEGNVEGGALMGGAVYVNSSRLSP